MKPRNFFSIIGEFGLLVLLFLIVTASFISVVSLSPLTFEEVLGDNNKEGEVAGKFNSELFVENKMNFVPALADENISFGNQKIGEDSYSTSISCKKIMVGENKISVMKLVNLADPSELEARVSVPKDELENMKVKILVGGESAELTDGLFQGKVFPYRFKVEKGEQVDLTLILDSEIQINYPVEILFELSKV